MSLTNGYKMRKDITVASIILLVGIISLIFLYIRLNYNYKESQPMMAIPTNAAVIIQVNHLNNLRSILFENSALINDLKKFETFEILNLINQYIDSSTIFKDSPGLEFLSRTILVSIHPDDQGKSSWVLSIPLKSRDEEKAMTKLIKSLQSNNGLHKFEGSTIYEIPKNKKFPISAFAAIYKGILSVSNLQEAIESSVIQRNKEFSFSDDVAFNKIHKATAQTNLASIYINYQNLEKFSYQLFGSEIKKPTFLNHIAKWSEFDVDIRNDAISLNGFTIAEEDGFFTKLFSGITPQKSEISQIIPAEAKFFMSYTFNQNSRFKENLTSFISTGENSEIYKKATNDFKTKNGINIEDAFFSFIDGECAMVIAEPSQIKPEGNRYMIFKTLGQAKTLENINKMLPTDEKVEEPVEWIVLDDQTKFPVYSGPSLFLMQMMWGQIFPEVPNAFFTFYRNFIVFANSTEELKTFMYSTVLNKSLSTHPYFTPFLENFAFQENFYLFAEVPYIFSLSQKSLNPSIFHPNNAQNQVLSKFYGAGIQLSSTGHLVYTSLFANYTPQRDKEPQTIWQSRLDSTIIGKPALVDNHNTGEKEILVQDNRNNLYLLNSMGRVLWKRPLEGPIKGEIVQIDFFRNNKLQYLFNTANRLYLIDRNGNHVANYPINLPALATNGLTVFDYEKNKDYRIFIALADNRVYLFDKNGNRNPGFSPPETEGLVTTPIQFFTTGGRDYIVFSDQYRNYILDRRGENRVLPARSFIRNPKSNFFLEGDGSDAKLVTTTQSGLLAKISLPSGECLFTELFDAPEDHFFTYIMDSDQKPIYVYVTQFQLLGFHENGQNVLSVDFEQPIITHADTYQFSANDLKFGILEKTGSRIHLINLEGKNYMGFPLKGNSRFSIGFFKSSAYRFNLIVGGDHNFLNNYLIE